MQAVHVSPDIARADFNRMLRRLGVNPEEFLINQDTLRLEKKLSADRSSYQFDLYQNSGSDRPLEKKLNRNDVFCITHLALGVCKEDTSTNPAQYANSRTYHSADPNYFAGAPAGQVKEFVSVQTAWNGKLTIKTNTTDRLQEFLTQLLEYIPERGHTLQAGSQLNDEWGQYGPSLEEKGFFKLTPNIILNGQQNNKILMDLGEGDISSIEGTADSGGTAVNTRNVLVLLLHGFTIHEAADPHLRWGTV